LEISPPPFQYKDKGYWYKNLEAIGVDLVDEMKLTSRPWWLADQASFLGRKRW